jgi:putative ABC transport system ATP-binding protein
MELLRLSCEELEQTVIVVTHDARAAAYAQRVIFLRDGLVVKELCPEPSRTWNQKLRDIIDAMEELES